MEVDSEAAGVVRDALRAAGATWEPIRLDQPVPTATHAAAALGCEVGAIANSLVFRADDEPLLVVASGAARVDMTVVSELLGREVRRASPAFVLEHTGQEVGGVAPVGHPHPVPTILDVALQQHDELWAGAGDEWSMFRTSFSELCEMTGGTPAEVR